MVKGKWALWKQRAYEAPTDDTAEALKKKEEGVLSEQTP